MSAPFLHCLKVYYSLTKPRVLFGNTLSAVAGFLFATGVFGVFNLSLLVAFTIGITLVMAAACVMNNVFDRDIDSQMERTKDRAMVTGEARELPALVYGTFLLVLGMALLHTYTNALTTYFALVGFFVYVWCYGEWGKRKSVHGTAVGAVSGAIPIFAGYVAVTGIIDFGAILVFLALFFWQFSEFFSISIYRREEYRKAGVPVVSVVRGVAATKRQIFVYTILFVISTLLLTPFGFLGYWYFVPMVFFGAYYIWLGFIGLRTKESETWSRKMFHYGLVMLVVYSFLLCISPLFVMA